MSYPIGIEGKEEKEVVKKKVGRDLVIEIFIYIDIQSKFYYK